MLHQEGWRWDITEEDMALAAVSVILLVLHAKTYVST